MKRHVQLAPALALIQQHDSRLYFARRIMLDTRQRPNLALFMGRLSPPSGVASPKVRIIQLAALLKLARVEKVTHTPQRSSVVIEEQNVLETAKVYGVDAVFESRRG